jgi:hypothetical protein
MHLKLLSCEFAEYRAIKAHSKMLALVWRLGHGAWALSGFCVLAVLLGFLTMMVENESAPAAVRWRFAGIWCGAYGFAAVVLFALGLALKWSARRFDAHR